MIDTSIKNDGMYFIDDINNFAKSSKYLGIEHIEIVAINPQIMM
jgi:hypothetical protein